MQDKERLQEITDTIKTSHRSKGEVVEIRILNTPKQTVSGYFDNYKTLATSVEKYNGKHDIYMTLNPINPALLARCSNRLQPYAKQTTSDKDIAVIKWILVDIDPKRASGISANREEKKAALKLAKKIREDLMKQDFPAPVFCDSGNGYHLLFPVDLENNAENVKLISRFLEALDFLYSNGQAEVDRTTYNPSRIVKLYGTKACKGDNTKERPHRWSKIREVPNTLNPVAVELIQAVAEKMPKVESGTKSKKTEKTTFNLAEWIEKHNIAVAYQAPFRNQGTKYILKTCPWNPEHTDRSAYIIQFKNGAIAAGCQHNGCQDEKWQTLRQLLDPEEAKPEEDDDNGGEPKQADLIIELASDFQYFRNDLEEPYVAVKIGDHWEVMAIKSNQFSLFLVKLYYEETGEAPKTEIINQALRVLETKAIFSDNQRPLQRRMAKDDDCYYYDLCDENWRAVKISENGASIAEQPPILFTRNANMEKQAEPDISVQPKRLVKLVKKHFRFKNQEDAVLFTVYLVSCFLPQIAHVILVLFGEKGSAKSTTMKMIKRLVDPAKQNLLAMPTSKTDLAVLLANTYMPAFDNLDSLSAEKSDMLCMAATGGAFSKRMLYTDSDEIILQLKRCVTLNGINVVATRPDLLDRSIVLELERIPTSKRKTEEDIWDSFEKDICRFLGAIFNTLARAISIRESVKLEEVGRMADFGYWGYAIAEVLEIGGDTFLDAYLINQNRANEEALESNPVAAAVIAFMENRSKWSSSVSALLKELEKTAEQKTINTRVKTWPKDSSVLSKRLKEVKSNLEEVRIYYDIRHAGNFKRITIENRNVAVKTKTESQTNELDEEELFPTT